MTESDRADPFEVHRTRVADVLPRRNAREIKALYAELGSLLEVAVGADADAPQLSFPETPPVVSRLLASQYGRLLDAGCGPNPSTALLLAADPRRTVVAVDIAEGMVRLARSSADRVGVTLHAAVADLEALPFRVGAFDGAVCDDTIEHVPDDRQAMAELSRVLATPGRLVLATPNRQSAEVILRKAQDRVLGRRRPPSAYYAATSHLREYTWREVERLAGPLLRVQSRGAVPWSGGWKKRLLSWLTARPPLRRFGRVVVLELAHRQGLS